MWHTPDEKGVTRSERAVRFGMGHTVPDLTPPEHGEHHLTWFRDLSAGRQAGLNGPQPLSCQEIMSWLALTGERLTREDVLILRQMDDAYLTGVREWRDWKDSLNKTREGAR